MRAILVAVMVVMVAMTGPAFAGGITHDEELREHRDQRSKGDVESTMPPPAASREVVVEEYHSAGAEFALGLASTVLSLIYHPPRMVLGVIGAELGGFGGWATGGDLRTAKALWRPTVEGDYFMRPGHLDGAEPFRPVNTNPVFQGRYTVHEMVDTRGSTTEEGYDDGSGEPGDLESEELEDGDTHEHAVEEQAPRSSSRSLRAADERR